MALDLQQQEARDTINTNVLVSASAGAGKTSVLVARLVKRCLKDLVPIKRIVALTFTKAAAEEMKARLSSSFKEELKTCDDTMKEYIQDQIVGLEDADITTIDSYCLKIVEKYYTVIGLDPITCKHILDAGLASRLRHTAFLEALEEFYTNRKEETYALVTYFSTRSEDYETLESTITKIQTHANSCFDVNSFYTEAKEKYYVIHSLKEMDPSLLKAFYDEKKLQLETMHQLILDMQKASLEDENIDQNTLIAYDNGITNCVQALDNNSYSLYLSALENLAIATTSANGKNKSYTTIRKKCNDLLKDLLTNTYSEDILVKDVNTLVPYAHTLIDLTKRCQEIFSGLKLKDKTIDFTDMERFSLDILKANDNEVAKILQDSYDEIMVDEFQDTSVLQNEIITTISNGHNVFRVGDVKQSIYRFRQAKPSLMQSMMNDPSQHCIHLKHNFRSRECVVNFNNTLFEKAMNIDGFKDTYLEEDHQEIGTDSQKEDPFTAVLALVENADEFGLKGKQGKATWIAQQILRLHEEGYNYRDCAVLTRNHENKLAIKSAFDKYNIPYDIDTRQGFFNSTLCTDILSIVTTILDPTDPIALTATLTSSLYRFTIDTLSMFKVKYKSIYKGVQQEHPNILTELNELKYLAETQGVVAFLQTLANLHHFYVYLDDLSQTNFDFLLQKIQNSDLENLYGFKVFLETGTEENSSEAMSKGKQDDLVRVVTIHQSKGLQYQIVFLFSDTQNTNKDSSALVSIHDEQYLGLKYIDPIYKVKRESVYSSAINHLCNLEDLEEFTRLFYVALTRAVQRIYVVEDGKKVKEATSLSRASINLRKGTTGLLLSAMQDDPALRIEHTQLVDIPSQKISSNTYCDTLPTYPTTECLPPLVTPSETEVTRIPSLDHISSSGTSYGTHIHEVIELLPNTQWSYIDLDKYDLQDNDVDKLIHFSNSDIYLSCLKKTIEKEKQFFVIDKKNNQTIKGAMDFVAYDDSSVILIDFKTDSATKEVIKERYTEQLLTYKQALEILYPKHTYKIYAYSFHNESYIEIA